MALAIFHWPFQLTRIYLFHSPYRSPHAHYARHAAARHLRLAVVLFHADGRIGVGVGAFLSQRVVVFISINYYLQHIYFFVIIIVVFVAVAFC